MTLTSVLLSVAVAHTLLGQAPGATSPPPAAPRQEQLADPIGRTTPRATITAFMRAAGRGDYVSAARYMQVTESQRRNTERLARDLKFLMDRYFSEAVTSISDSPEGSLDDGLPIDRERVGPLTIGEAKTDIALVNVTDPQSGRVWLISSETLSQIPALRGLVARTWIERAMPQPLVRRELFGMSLAHWIAFAASFVIPFVLLMALGRVVVFLAERIAGDPARRRSLDEWYAVIRWPAIIVLTLAIQLTAMRLLGFPLVFRIGYAHVGLVAGVIALTWLVRRILTLGFARARRAVWGSDSTSTQSLMLLGERLIQVLVVVVAVMAILTIVGVNTKAALAGLGIGGIALALGAQKTVENLLGGVFLLSDRALAVGDTCSVSNRVGVVEDVTLRSVRIRTMEQTLLSVPAGILAQSNVENFATRSKILAKTILRVRYGTTAEQLGLMLTGIRRLMAENPKIETETSRVRLVDFGDRAVEIELFAYVLTVDFLEFLAVREDLLLQVVAIVESSGSGFAQPTQFVYMDRNGGVDGRARESVTYDDVGLGQPTDVRPGPLGDGASRRP
jgi:MscS family membrane protein